MAGAGEISQSRWRGGTATALVALAGLIGALAAGLLFEQAVPQVRLEQRLTAPLALERARAFAAAHALPFAGRTAVRFAEDDSLQVFLELSDSGGKAALDRVARAGDVALYRWTVRAFAPGDVHETRVRLAPDGRVTGFARRFAESDARPALDSATALARARDVLTNWMAQRAGDWTLMTASHEVVPASGRVDWSFTFEHVTRRVAGARVRFVVDLAGDAPRGAGEHVVIPEAFARRYAEMRSSNELFAQMATFGFPLYGLIALIALYRGQRDGTVRWRGALVGATAIALLQASAMANEIPSRWFDYPTSAPPGAFLVQLVLGALLVPALFGAFLVVVLAGGERLTRAAFPQHLDWWAAWRGRAHPRVLRQVLAGYALCAVGLGYVATFYFVARTVLGWWVPSALLDDPNQIATPLPFISAIANAAQAGVMEEVLFRAVPLSAVALLTRGRSWHRAAMAAAVVGTALVFGFAHASYASWPAYSRGVELFAEATLWAVIFLRFGLVPTVVCHFAFDLFLFGLFAMAGDAPAYRLTLAVVVAVLLAPAAIVAWAAWRKRGDAPEWEGLTFGAWRAPAEAEEAAHADGERPGESAAANLARARDGRDDVTSGVGSGAVGAADAERASAAASAVGASTLEQSTTPGRDWRWPAIALGLVALAAPRVAILEPRFTVDRARAIAIADSALRARGAQLDGLVPMAETIENDDPEGARYFAHVERPDLAPALSRSYRALAGWGVRFDRREGTPSEKAEGWRIHLLADGTPHDWRHVMAEEAPRPEVDRATARTVALAAAAASGVDTTGLRDAGVEEERRPKRKDLRFTFTDTHVLVPGGASARVRVRVAGAEAMGVARTLRFPERWERADAAEQDRRGTMLMVAGIVGVLVVLVLATRLARRPSVRDDHPVSRRGAIVLGVTGVIVLVARGVQALPDALAQWDSATPWASHQLAVALAIGAQLFALVVPASLWIAADALRRRLGIVAVAGARASLRSGAALGAIAFATTQAVGVARALRGATWSTPTTWMGTLWPEGAGALGVLNSLAVVPLLVALPAMLVAGSVRGRWARPLVLVGGGLAAGGLVVLRGGDVARGGAVVAAVAIVLGYAWWHALKRWGADGMAAWVIAAASSALLSQLRMLREQAHPADRVAVAVAVLTAAAVIVGVARYAERRSRGSRGDVPNPAVSGV